jgi:predicted RNA-binding protein with TRAM domain
MENISHSKTIIKFHIKAKDSPFILGRKLTAPKPVETGKEYEVDVTEVSRQGDGIARVRGYIIFVKNGRPGQKLKIQVNQVGARFATATIVVPSTQ